MKIGMKEDMGVAEEMALLVLAPRTHRARICVRSAPDCTYSQFMVARSEGLL